MLVCPEKYKIIVSNCYTVNCWHLFTATRDGYGMNSSHWGLCPECSHSCCNSGTIKISPSFWLDGKEAWGNQHHQRIKEELRKEESQRRAPNDVWKLSPNLWLIPESYMHRANEISLQLGLKELNLDLRCLPPHG